VREGFRAAPFFHQRNQILDLLSHVIKVGHLVVHADEPAFGTRPVVTGDVNEQRIVHLTDVFQSFD
jgi:hypothetical protein